jgi:D-alanine--poly(phosphoribitol) ligase subunit 1
MAYSSNLALAWSRVVERFSERRALYFPESDFSVTYKELDQVVAQIVSYLHSQGLKQGDVVVMLNDKSVYGYASLLACLRLGVIYANLDINSPWERISKIIRNCEPKFLLSTYADGFDLLSVWPECQTPMLSVRDVDQVLASENLPEIWCIAGNAPAYIMYTSGSTGIPKGAVMSHANLLWFIQWSQNRFSIGADDVLTNVNPIYFDNSVFDFYSAFFSGACLVPFTQEQVQSVRNLVGLVNKAKCTIWFSVPSLLIYLLTTRTLSASSFTSVRKIIFGGEGFPKPKLKQLFDLLGDRIELENVYGPTECTCICSAYTVSNSDFDDMQNLAPLGVLAQNFDFEILSDEVSKEPNMGELFLRGPQVGLGYYNDTVRTHSGFVQNPKQNKFLEIGYRTGDLVQLDARGFLNFKGRVDFQIKHMGYRIELEEIEAVISTISGVDECAVIYRKDRHGFGQIMAVWAGDTKLQNEQSMLFSIATILPSYMHPKRVIHLTALPKNANGKIDRLQVEKLISEME